MTLDRCPMLLQIDNTNGRPPSNSTRGPPVAHQTKCGAGRQGGRGKFLHQSSPVWRQDWADVLFFNQNIVSSREVKKRLGRVLLLARTKLATT